MGVELFNHCFRVVCRSQLTQLPNPDPAGFVQMTMWGFPMSPDGYGAAGALVHMPSCPPGGSTLVYFSCDDCAVEAARAVAHGGQVFKPKMSIGLNGFIALVTDTEGNTIGLHSMK